MEVEVEAEVGRGRTVRVDRAKINHQYETCAGRVHHAHTGKL